MNNFTKGLLLGFAIGLLSLMGYLYKVNKKHKTIGVNEAENYMIIISKEDQTLTVYHPIRETIKSYKVSTGENPGNKIMKGDLKTPEGIFPVIGIEDASSWTYDFKDGMGPIVGAYGPLFIRLQINNKNIFPNVNIKFKFTSENKFLGIGIHGTNLNELIGRRASHGCIRLKNEDLVDLRKYIEPGTLVAIIPGKIDEKENSKLN
jgi:hypothetical protein